MKVKNKSLTTIELKKITELKAGMNSGRSVISKEQLDDLTKRVNINVC